MIRDRGKIKWTSMMLPEHVKLLRDWANEDAFEQAREVDEQYLEVMNETIFEAMEFEKMVAVTYYHQHKYEIAMGYIREWDELNQKLHVVDSFKETHRIPLQSIADVRFAD